MRKPAPAAPAPKLMAAAATAPATKPSTVSPAAKTKPKAAAPVINNTQSSAKTPPTSTSTAHEYRVQLAASRSEENIRRDWSSYQSRYSDIFGALDASVERAEVGEEKTVWYRLRVGPFESVASAKQLCETLSARGIKTGCLPLRVSR
jgi:cell division septation protein DedD